MTDLQQRLFDYIDQQLDGLAERPGMWGTPFAVEMQYLQALDFREEVRDPSDRRSLTRVWSGVLHQHDYLGNSPLAQQVEDQEEAYKALQELLPKLRAAVMGSIPV